MASWSEVFPSAHLTYACMHKHIYRQRNATAAHPKGRQRHKNRLVKSGQERDITTILRNVVVVVECIYEPYVFGRSVAASSAECNHCSPPWSLVCGQLLTVCEWSFGICHKGTCRLMQRPLCSFVGLFVYSSIHIRKQKHNFTREAPFVKHKTTVWIKWPTEGRATYA